MQPSLFNNAITAHPLIFDFGLDDVYAPLKPKEKPVDPNVITFNHGTKSHQEVIDNWMKMNPSLRHKKVELTFACPVSLMAGKNKRTEPKKTHQRRLFVEKASGSLCYTSTTRTGFYFDLMDLHNLIKIEPILEVDMVEKVRKLANRFYPGVWGDQKTKLLTQPEEVFANYGYTVTSITNKFPRYILDEIRKAFEEKSNYSYDTGGYSSKKKTGRDLKVQCKLCDDGIYRAWFSSEFPGCANGDYWILINPTTAICKERD